MKMMMAVLLTIGMVFALNCASAQEIMYLNGYPDTFLRSDPSTEHPYLARMPYGSEVSMIDEGKTWCVICYNGQYGYCKRKFLQDDDPYGQADPHPESAEEAFGTNMLRRGNKTPDFRVMNLQLCLIEGGYLDEEAGIDGYFGRKTKGALAEFQKEHNMAATGQAGDLTKTILWDEYCDLLMESGYKR